jgi:hypothetical protein
MMKKKTHEEFVKQVYSLVGKEYEVIGIYKNSKTKIKILHRTCGKIFEISPNNFINGYRCSKCATRVLRNDDEFKTEINTLTNGEYVVLGQFNGTGNKIEFLHRACNNAFYMTPNHFLRGVRCPYCAWNSKKSQEKFIEEVKSISGNEYKVLSKYKGRNVKIKLKHLTCGNVWEVDPNHFLRGVRCPYCKESKGERKIRKILTKHGIEFKSQYIIKACRNKGYMPFDFAVFNGCELLFLCEYQGMQHYEPIEFFGGDKALLRLEDRDRIKKQYCEENGIPLLIIDCREKQNIEKLVIDFYQAVSIL